jgi:hypothetical protein
MTRVADAAKWIAFAVADGPLPSSAGRQAWAHNGFPPRDERTLSAALRRAGVTPEHHGHPRMPQSWWWKAPGDQRPIGGILKAHECNTCRRILHLPDQRPCISTPRCPGWYEPAPTAQQPTNHPQCGESFSFDADAWRSERSPLLSRAYRTRRSGR